MRKIIDVKMWLKEPPIPTIDTQSKLYKKVRQGLPHKKDGRNLLFDLQAVERWFLELPGSDSTLEG